MDCTACIIDSRSRGNGRHAAGRHPWLVGAVTSGVAINWASGPSLLFGTELGGLGSSQFLTWSGRSRLSVPF